jgi:hypothetical protein
MTLVSNTDISNPDVTHSATQIKSTDLLSEAESRRCKFAFIALGGLVATFIATSAVVGCTANGTGTSFMQLEGLITALHIANGYQIGICLGPFVVGFLAATVIQINKLRKLYNKDKRAVAQELKELKQESIKTGSRDMLEPLAGQSMEH